MLLEGVNIMKRLKQAILREDIQAIKKNAILETKFPIRNSLLSPFEFAALHGKLKIICFLIEKQYIDLAFVNQLDDNYFLLSKALKYAAKGGHFAVVSYLINYIRETQGKEKLTLLLDNYFANTALTAAAVNEHTKLFTYFCSQVDELLSPQEATTVKGIALFEAIKEKALTTVNHFISLPDSATEVTDQLKERTLSLLKWSGGELLITAIKNHCFKLADSIVATLLKLSGKEEGNQILARQLIHQVSTFVGAVKAKDTSMAEYIFALAPTKECREWLLANIKTIDPVYACALPQRISKMEQETLVARKLHGWALTSKSPFQSELFQSLPSPILDVILKYITGQDLEPGMALKIAKSLCYEEIKKQKSQPQEVEIKQDPVSPWTARLQKKESFFKRYTEVSRN